MKVINPSIQIFKQLSYNDILTMIELGGRTCYKSEDKINDVSAEKFIREIIKKNHKSVLEHSKISCKVICDRAIANELVRHRIASFSQECIAGSSKLKFGLTVHDAYILLQDKKYEMQILSINDRNVFFRNNVINIVYKGVQKVYEVISSKGYKIRCTINTKFKSLTGEYITLDDLIPGNKVFIGDNWEMSVNGIIDEIISIREDGCDETYDIEMARPDNNFVADGFVVHNSTRYCSYDQDKFGNEITVIKPLFYKEYEPDIPTSIWYDAMSQSEEAYFKLLSYGLSPQHARSVLPSSLKTEIMITSNIREWHTIIEQRLDLAAHPQMIQIMIPIVSEFIKLYPALFDCYGNLLDRAEVFFKNNNYQIADSII